MATQAQIEEALRIARRNGYVLTRKETPQRQTLVEGANVQHTTPGVYRHGAYLREQLAPSHWAALADRSNPWPKDVSPKLALKEMGAFLSLRIAEQEARMQGIEL